MAEFLIIACSVLAIITVILALTASNKTREAAVAKAKLESARQKISELESSIETRRAEDNAHFQSIATQVLHANSAQLDHNNRRTIETLLAPLSDRLDSFTRNIRECYDTENRDRAAIKQEIDSLARLNQRVIQETARLSSALKGNNSFQGRWGEMILVNILEHSGLERSEWFVTQQTSTTSDGSVIRPDAIIHCPGNRDIIIDAKTSLTAYLASLEADNDQDRNRLLNDHLKSVEKHIKSLSSKDYQKKIGAGSSDFVFMFMPHEGAFLAALNTNPDLWQQAFDSKVVVVSPTHLVTALHLVEHMWKIEKQTINAEKIARQGARLADSIVMFLKDLDQLGESIARTQRLYDSAVSRLNSNRNSVAAAAHSLSELGVKPSKPIPERFDDNKSECN